MNCCYEAKGVSPIHAQHTTGGRWHKQRRPPPAEHAVHTHVFDRINVIRYLFGASNQQDSRTMTIPKPTNEMAMVHLDGWTDRTDSRAPERFPCDLVFSLRMNLVCRSATDRQSHLKETRSTVNYLSPASRYRKFSGFEAFSSECKKSHDCHAELQCWHDRYYRWRVLVTSVAS